MATKPMPTIAVETSPSKIVIPSIFFINLFLIYSGVHFPSSATGTPSAPSPIF